LNRDIRLDWDIHREKLMFGTEFVELRETSCLEMKLYGLALHLLQQKKTSIYLFIKLFGLRLVG